MTGNSKGGREDLCYGTEDVADRHDFLIGNST